MYHYDHHELVLERVEVRLEPSRDRLPSARPRRRPITESRPKVRVGDGEPRTSSRTRASRHSSTSAVCTKTSVGTEPPSSRCVSFTTTKTLLTPPSNSASPCSSDNRISSKGSPARKRVASPPPARCSLGRVSLTEGHGRLEPGATAHVSRRRRTRVGVRAHAPRTSRGGRHRDHHHRLARRRRRRRRRRRPSPSTTFAVVLVVAPEPARRWAPRARASPRPSPEARARSRTTPGRARGAPRACRAAASRVVPSRQTRVVARRPRRGVHAARGPLLQPRGRGRGNGGGARRRHVDTIHDQDGAAGGRAGRAARARSRLAVRARLIICDRERFSRFRAKIPTEDFSNDSEDSLTWTRLENISRTSTRAPSLCTPGTPSPRLRCTRSPPTRSPRRPPRFRAGPRRRPARLVRNLRGWCAFRFSRVGSRQKAHARDRRFGVQVRHAPGGLHRDAEDPRFSFGARRDEGERSRRVPTQHFERFGDDTAIRDVGRGRLRR